MSLRKQTHMQRMRALMNELNESEARSRLAMQEARAREARVRASKARLREAVERFVREHPEFARSRATARGQKTVWSSAEAEPKGLEQSESEGESWASRDTFDI